MKPLRGVWFAVGCGADVSPPLVRIREKMGDSADVYFYRAYSFAKQFSRRGCLHQIWEDVATFSRFPGSGREMEKIFIDCGLCTFDGFLYGWFEWNGRIVAALEADAKYRRDRYQAKKKKATKKRVKR